MKIQAANQRKVQRGGGSGGHTSVHDSGTTIEDQVALVQRWDMVEQVEGPQVPLTSLCQG